MTNWLVLIKVAGQLHTIGRVVETRDNIERAFPYSTIVGDCVTVWAMPKQTKGNK